MLTTAFVMASVVSIHAIAPQGPGDAAPGRGASDPFCTYPDRTNSAPVVLRAVTVVAESEPNGSVGTANAIALSASDPDINMTGSNFSNEDDYFSFALLQGDILGIACLGTFVTGGLDPQIKLLDSAGSLIVINDDGAEIYPASSPMPRGVHRTDSLITFVATTAGLYHILVEPFPEADGTRSEGSYTLQLRLRRNVFETEPTGTKQIVFVDFDGETIPAQSLFGGAQTPLNATLSPLSDFLGDWGLSAGDEDAVIDAILVEMAANFDFVSSANPNFAYDLRNSRDHADPFGVEPHVSRVVIGGTTNELGINTIGIAESIDPGNFATSETGVLLLDDLSDKKPISGTSLNNVPLDGGATIIDLIGAAVGNMSAHEVGHTLGNWHTDPSNSTRCVMDSGATTLVHWRQNYYQVGADGIFGTADDNATEFFTDMYFANENVGAFPSTQSTTARTAYAMSESQVLPCPADLNGDGMADGADLGLLLGNWGGTGASDLNGDGTVDGADLGLLLGDWGACS